MDNLILLIFYSLYFLLFLVYYSFLRYSSKKRTKRSAADCTSAAKLASLFTKRCKTTASRSYLCSAFNGKTSQSFHAAPVRSESYLQHRFARCTLTAIHNLALSVLTSEALIKSGAFSEKRGAPIRARSGRLAPLPKT